MPACGVKQAKFGRVGQGAKKLIRAGGKKTHLFVWRRWLRDAQNSYHISNPNVETVPMLSEHHDISHEFPEYRRMLDELRITDKNFDSLVAKHDYIDDEIRLLEERQVPVSDEEIEKMKFERTALKDRIYQYLRDQASKA